MKREIQRHDPLQGAVESLVAEPTHEPLYKNDLYWTEITAAARTVFRSTWDTVQQFSITDNDFFGLSSPLDPARKLLINNSYKLQIHLCELLYLFICLYVLFMLSGCVYILCILGLSMHIDTCR